MSSQHDAIPGKPRCRRTSVKLGLAAALAVLTLAVYWPVRNHDFVSYDDVVYIVENPNLRAGLTIQSALRAFTTAYETNWIPLTWISLQLDHQIFGLDPTGYHFTNVAFHVASTLLLFFALSRMSGAIAPSAFTAAVFAVHPLHVESVAWATERKDTLSGLFWMLALFVYAETGRRGISFGRHVGLLACMGFALLAKPIAVTLPFVLLLLDFWPLGRMRAGAAGRGGVSRTHLVIEKIPLLALAAAVSAVTIAVQRSTGALSHGEHLPLGVRLANGVDSYVWYLVTSFWPSRLAVFYPHPLEISSVWRVAAGALLLVAVSAVLLRAARARPHLAMGWLWFAVTLIPVIGLVQAGMQARADRYMYLPLIGLAIALAWSGAELVRRRPSTRVPVAIAGVVAIAALAVASRQQLSHWRDTVSLYERALAVTEDNFLAHHGLGAALVELGRLDEAEPHLREAVRLKPRWPDAHVAVGDWLATRGEPDAALERYRVALRLDPAHARAHTNLGVVLVDQGRAAEAISHLRHALTTQRNIGFAHLHALLGQALIGDGDLDAGIRHYQISIERRPDFPEARANLGFALLRVGRSEDARDQLRHARALGLESPELALGLARAEETRGHLAAAIAHYREALRLAPELPGAANNLAWLLATRDGATAQDGAAAVEIATRSLAHGGREPARLDTLAAALARAGRFEAAVRRAGEAETAAIAAEESELAEAIHARRALYRSGRPYTEGAPGAR